MECTDLYGALPAAGADLFDGGAAAISLFDQPQICDSRGAYRAAGRDAGPAGSAGRRILLIQIEAAVEGPRSRAGGGTGARRGGCRAGQPGFRACDEAAGAASGSEAYCREPAGVSRWSGNRKTAGAGDPAAGSVRAVSGAEFGWAACAENFGAATGDDTGGIEGRGDQFRAGPGGAGASHCAF